MPVNRYVIFSDQYFPLVNFSKECQTKLGSKGTSRTGKSVSRYTPTGGDRAGCNWLPWH